MTLKGIVRGAGALLLSPISVFFGIGAGVYVGLADKAIASQLAWPGTIYLSLLQMCVLPLMISAVILSIGKLFQSDRSGNIIFRIGVVFLSGMLLAALIGVAAGALATPGANLSIGQKATLGKEVLKSEQDGSLPDVSSDDTTAWHFISDIVPINIFKSAAEGQSLSVLFFCLAIGTALGSLKTTNSAAVLQVANALYDALLKIIGWLMYGLPFGLACLFASQVSSIGAEIFLSLLRLLLTVFVGALLLLVCYAVIIWLRSGLSFIAALFALKGVLIIAFGTSSSFAAIPFALEGLHSRLSFKKDAVDLVIPLGTTLNPQGNILYFAMVAVFMAQLYGKPLSAADHLLIVPLAALAGVAASSAPGIAGLSMLSLVLDPFGLPMAVGMVLLSAIDPILDPILTTVNVYGNCAATTLVSSPTAGEQELGPAMVLPDSIAKGRGI